jgi:prepilin-type N-terminal cleavage/methylation domain-containing protein
MKNSNSRKSGFTIIEVLIVLAIAGLIILIVFLAVPAMRRAERNYRRRDDVATSLAYLLEIKNNNGGNYPPGSCNNLTPNSKTGADCWVLGIKMKYYTHNTKGQPESAKAVSYADLASGVGGYTGPYIEGGACPGHVCHNLDPDNPDPLGEHISVRTYTKCKTDGSYEFTGTNASPTSIAAQFLIETANGWVLQCLDYS